MSRSINVQQSLRAWAVQSSSARTEPSGPSHEDRVRKAASLGLEWPRPLVKKRRVGRPTFRDRWLDRVYEGIEYGNLPESVTTATPPAWWTPSMPLNVTQDEAEQMAADMVGTVHRERALGIAAISTPGAEEAAENTEAGACKRPKIHHGTEVKDWFLDLVAIQKRRKNWSYITTFRHAQAVAPEIFGPMSQSVPLRWKHSDPDSCAGAVGRPKKVPDNVAM